MSPNGKNWTKVNLSSLHLKRPNYPFNCFTLDLSKNIQLNEKSFKYVWFDFFEHNGTSVEIFLEDKNLACTRQIIEDRFYFTGPQIKQDIGKYKLKPCKKMSGGGLGRDLKDLNFHSLIFETEDRPKQAVNFPASLRTLFTEYFPCHRSRVKVLTSTQKIQKMRCSEVQ